MSILFAKNGNKSRINSSTQDGQRVFLRWSGYPSGVSRYTQGTWEFKLVVVLYNAQLFTRGLSIYNWVHEVPFYILQGYVKGRSIHWWYMEEPRESQVVVRKNNDSSYTLWHPNMSLTYHSNFYTIFRPKDTVNFI